MTTTRFRLVFLLDYFILSNYQFLNWFFTSFPFFCFLISIVKAVASWLSGRSWLHRICSDRRNWVQRKGRVIQLIALHLHYTRSLKAEAKLLFNSPKDVSVDLDRLAKIIALKKKIPLESESFGILKESLVHIVHLEKLILHVIKRARSAFKPKEHLEHLQSLWINLHLLEKKDNTEHENENENENNTQVPGIPDKKWQELGFQGTDPSTDFRGMGLLGLDQLVNYSKLAPKSAHNLWQQSKFGSAWFTFATVGINITAFLYGLLVSRSADEYFYTQSTNHTESFDQAYQIIFEQFGQYWIIEGARDVMDFSRIFGKLKNDLERNLENFYYSGQLFSSMNNVNDKDKKIFFNKQ